ncbi:MAG TPA: TonB-dependent receptor, partial [Nevskiaceae bacterium]|nr:TonB-dependent receptor [Nevskiaceae bacterium]
ESVAAPAAEAAPGATAGPAATIPVAQPPPAQPAEAETPTDPGVPRIDSIVVTAEKREERLQDVPVSMSVINQEQLERANITQVTDLNRAAPSIEVNGEPGNADTRISIRGISTNSFSVTAEQAVSLVVDGVVLGKAPSVSLFDIARVEILRGPQGTLFGKNASAGVVSIITNAPDPSRFSIGGHVDLGSKFGYRLAQASVNLPITDDLAIRINAGQTYTKGFIHNVVRNEDSKQDISGARARILWKPLDDFSLNLIADYEKQYTSEQMYIQFEDNNDPATGQPQPLMGCPHSTGGPYAGQDNRISCGNNPTYNDGHDWGLSAQLEYDLNGYILTSISSLRRYAQFDQIDVDGVNGNYYDNSNTFNNKVITQELRIASPVDDRLKWVTGLFYSKSHVPNHLTQTIGSDILLGLGEGEIQSPPVGLPFTLPVPGVPCAQLNICTFDFASLNQPNDYDAEIKSAAAFGQLTFRLFDPLRLIAGLRYTHDDVAMTSVSYIGVATGNPLIPDTPTIPQNAPLLGRDVVNNLSWRTGLQYDLAKDSMAYLTVSHGYKGPQIVFVPPNDVPGLSGTQVQLPTPAQINHVKPEYPMDYELGIKSTLFDGLLATNADVFYTKIKDFQSSVFNGQGKFTPDNIPSVVTQGVELDVFGYLWEGLTLNSGLLYNKVTYPHPYFVNCTQVGPKCPDTKDGTAEDIGGKQLVIAPRWKVTFSPEYSFKLIGETRGFITSDIVYRSPMHFTDADDTRTELGSHTIIGARLGLRGADDNWEISLFGRNLTNQRNPAFLFAPYLLGSVTQPTTENSAHALSTESLRFFGVSIGARY